LTIEQVGEEELRGIEQQRELMTRMDEVSMQIQGVSDQVAGVNKGVVGVSEQVKELAGQIAVGFKASSTQLESVKSGLGALHLDTLRIQADAKLAGARAEASVLRNASRSESLREEWSGGSEAPLPPGVGAGASARARAGVGAAAGAAAGAGEGVYAGVDAGVDAGVGVPSNGGVVAVMCSRIPRVAAGLAEVPGCNRLQGEAGALKRAGACMLWPASTESMVDSIEEHNPSVVHIAGHNHYREGGPRLMGFSEGGDGDGLTEINPEQLADFIVGSAVACGAGNCALECVVLSTCQSVTFAQALLSHATRDQYRIKSLRVVCWPELTDDLMCLRYAKGFYKHLGLLREKRALAESDWISVCHANGLRQVRIKKVKLNPELLRGDSNLVVTQVELPQLFDAQCIRAKRGDEGAGAKFVMVTVDTPRGHEALQKLHRVLEEVTGAMEGPQCRQAPTDSIRSLFGEVELSWRVKFEGDLADVLKSHRQFIDDLTELCGEDAVTWKLCQGSIVAHITSPIRNYRRARARFGEASAGNNEISVRCGGFTAKSVELGDWIMIDSEAWSQLDQEAAARLRDSFDEAGLGHLLKVLLLLAEPTLRCGESQCVGKPWGEGSSRDEEDAVGTAIRDLIRDSIDSGAFNEESRSNAIAAAMDRGYDKEAAIALVDKRLRESAANEKWKQVQVLNEQQRQPMLDLLSRTGKTVDCISVDLVCKITTELFVDPVTTVDGETYERGAIEHWFALGNTTSPSTNQQVDPSFLISNVNLRQRLTTFKEELQTELIKLVPLQYKTIQAAVDAAADGAVVVVSHGKYAENITIQGKRVGLVAADGDEGEVVVSGRVFDGMRDALTVTAVSGGVITVSGTGTAGLEIRGIVVEGEGAEGNGIEVRGAGSATIHGCTVRGCPNSGVSISGEGSMATLRSNTIHSNKKYGVEVLGGSAGSVLESNLIHTNDGQGVFIDGEGSMATLTSNIIHGNKKGEAQKVAAVQLLREQACDWSCEGVKEQLQACGETDEMSKAMHFLRKQVEAAETDVEAILRSGSSYPKQRSDAEADDQEQQQAICIAKRDEFRNQLHEALSPLRELLEKRWEVLGRCPDESLGDFTVAARSQERLRMQEFEAIESLSDKKKQQCQEIHTLLQSIGTLTVQVHDWEICLGEVELQEMKELRAGGLSPQKAGASGGAVCYVCEEEAATLQCGECDGRCFCEDCSAFFHRKGVKKSHTPIAIGSSKAVGKQQSSENCKQQLVVSKRQLEKEQQRLSKLAVPHFPEHSGIY
jgi:parallel beta-helix repeat protein